MGKIQVLHIIKSLGRGGAEMLLPETIRLHNKAIFEFHVIYFLPWKDQLVQAIEEVDGKVVCFEAKDNFRLMLQYKKIIAYCQENKIDMIHCHLPWAGFVGRLVHQKTKIPVIYTEHNLQERYHWVTKLINKRSFNYQTLALGVSNDVTKSIVSNIKPNIPVKTLLNGVNTSKFARSNKSAIRSDLGIPPDSIVFGNVAVFRFQKRLVEWLQVFSEIRQKNPNTYGMLIGAGPLEDEIKRELQRLNLEDCVFLPGLQAEVRPYLEAIDIFMMSSQFEGLPIALLEAMSMECAVISTDAGGIKEVVRNAQDGLICTVSDWQELSRLGQELINDPRRLQDLKKAARKRVVESFSLEKMVMELEDYYVKFKSAGL